MATTHKLPVGPWRAILETALYANSVGKTTMAELYALSLKQPDVIVTSERMYKPEKIGLPRNARILVSQDGRIVGRTANARRLVSAQRNEKSR